MTTANAFRGGIALGITVGIGYSVCTLVFWIWPEAALTFMNGLFHGLDFRRLQGGPTLFSYGSFIYAVVGMMVWAFALGAIYAWLQGRSGREV